jgi:hypothetical protein
MLKEVLIRQLADHWTSFQDDYVLFRDPEGIK